MSELVNLISAFSMRGFLERNQKEISMKMRSSGSEFVLSQWRKKKIHPHIVAQFDSDQTAINFD